MGLQLGVEESQPLGLIGEPADAAAALQQGAHRVQAGVGVKRRPGQLQHHRRGIPDHFGGRRGQPGLADPGLTAKHHPCGAQGAGQRPRPTLVQARQFAVPAHQRTAGRTFVVASTRSPITR